MPWKGALQGSPSEAAGLMFFWEAQGLSLLREWFPRVKIKVAAPRGQPSVLRSSSYSPLRDSSILKNTEEPFYERKEEKGQNLTKQSFPM